MNVKRIIIYLFIFFLLFPLVSQEVLQSEKYIEKIKELNSSASPGRQILVLIAIDKYSNRLPLKDHVSNAENIKKVIMTKYYIDKVVELYDFYATSSNINKLFRKLQTDLKKNDSLFIYFSGHGYIDPKDNMGYWIPSDAGINEEVKENWISSKEIAENISKIKAGQVCLISDSCFTSEVLNINNDVPKKMKMDDLQKAFTGSSREVLASGIMQTGSERSEFAFLIKDALRKSKDRYVALGSIYNAIEPKMSDSVPLFGSVKGSGHTKNAGFLLVTREKDPVKYEEVVEKTRVKVVAKDRTPRDTTKIAVKEMTEKELKKTYFNKVLFTPKKLNRAAIILLPIGSTIALGGIGLLVFDFVAMFPRVDELSRGNDYWDYSDAYENNIAFFASGIVWTVVGLGIMSMSLSLRLYSKKKQAVTFNIDVNDDVELSLSYKFKALNKRNKGL